VQITIRENSGNFIGYIQLKCGTLIWAEYSTDILEVVNKIRHHYGTMLQRTNDFIVYHQR